VSADESALRILLVTARAEEVKTLGGPLARERVAVALAKSVAGACEALSKQAFDAVVVSHPLPDAEVVGSCAALSAVAGCPPILVLDTIDRTREVLGALPADARPARCIARPVDGAKLAALLRELALASSEATPDSSVDRRGFANVLLDLADRAETGVLEARFETVTTRVYVRRGVPISVEGGSLRATLGRLLVRAGKLSERDYERVIQRMTEHVIDNEHQRMGEVLIELGLMKPVDVYQALSEQAGDKIIEAFVAPRVELCFEAASELPRAIEPLAIPPFPALLIEAVKRHFSENEQNELILPIAGARMRVRDPAPDLQLCAEDMRIAAALGRASSVNELWRSNASARATISALALAGALVPHAAPVTSRASSPAAPRTPIAAVRLVRRPSKEFARDVVTPRKPQAAASAAASDDAPTVSTARREDSKLRLEAEQLFQSAKKLVEREKFNDALAALQRAVALQPNEPEYRMLEAWAGYLSARVTQRIARAKAIACARKMIEADPRAAQPHTILGRLLLDDGDSPAATRELEQALLRDPTDEEAKKSLAQARGSKSPK
jgi:Flp pilus assembly protein TadD/DNA-binding response OmpR family regulator